MYNNNNNKNHKHNNNNHTNNLDGDKENDDDDNGLSGRNSPLQLASSGLSRASFGSSSSLTANMPSTPFSAGLDLSANAQSSNAQNNNTDHFFVTEHVGAQ